MENDPRFLTLLSRVASSSLCQFEIYRQTRRKDYDGEYESENLASDEQCRIEEITDRVWRIAVRLYNKLISKGVCNLKRLMRRCKSND